MYKQIEEIYKDVYEAINHNAVVDITHGGYIGVNTDGLARELYDDGYRKASEVAREIFEAFRDEMRSLIATSKELFNECEDDYYEGKKDAFFTAIIHLDELIKKKYTEDTK